MNTVVDTLRGVQLAGLLNFSRNNQGFQLAIVNINDTVPGTSIGLLNLVWRGYNKLEVYGNEVLYLAARVKLGTRKFYNIFGFGTQGFAKQNVWGYTYGLGGVFHVGKKSNDLNIELTLTDLQDDDSWIDPLNINGRLNIHYGKLITKRVMVFGGPSLNSLFYKESNLTDDPFLRDIPPYTLFTSKIDNVIINGWIGFELGLRFF